MEEKKRESEEKVEKRKRGKRQREQTRKNEDRRKIERLKRKRERERKEKGARLRHAGSMPTNYECKVMVILISSAEREKNGRNKTGGNVSPCIVRRSPIFGLSLFLSLPQYTLFRTSHTYPSEAHLSRVR